MTRFSFRALTFLSLKVHICKMGRNARHPSKGLLALRAGNVLVVKDYSVYYGIFNIPGPSPLCARLAGTTQIPQAILSVL